MDAVSHRETAAHKTLFRGTAAQKVQAASLPQIQSMVPRVKRMAMNAVANVETVAQVGTVRLAAGVGVYVAHIRQVDRENQKDRAPKPPEKSYYGRSQGFLKE